MLYQQFILEAACRTNAGQSGMQVQSFWRFHFSKSYPSSSRWKEVVANHIGFEFWHQVLFAQMQTHLKDLILQAPLTHEGFLPVGTAFGCGQPTSIINIDFWNLLSGWKEAHSDLEGFAFKLAASVGTARVCTGNNPSIICLRAVLSPLPGWLFFYWLPLPVMLLVLYQVKRHLTD